MAQIFPAGANTIAKISIVAAVALPALLVGAAMAVTRGPFNTKVGVAPDQPVPFSHEHHVSELGIDCRYCHTSVEKSSFAGVPPTETCMTCHSQVWTNSPLLQPVRDSYATGQPLRWTRVNRVPDFVYFNHSIHVNRGINCNICHGPVQKMMLTYKAQPFFMSWCLDCHRAPERFIRPREQEFSIYTKAQNGATTTSEERAILDGQTFNRTPAQLAEGRKLVKQYGVKTDELTDCWICHR
jgi:hypothetical protein